MKTGYIWDRLFLGHQNNYIHPESPQRVENLEFNQINNDLKGLLEIKNDIKLGRPGVLRVHTNEYLQRLENDIKNGRQWFDYFDTKIKPDTLEVALGSVSSSIALTSAVCLGKIKNGFAAVRPPGHHANVNKAKGFCFFNNVAICARSAQQLYGLKKILIVDWDVHPGDGTMSIFYDDPDVHFLSVHQAGILSGSVGLEDQIGANEGEGATYNINLLERSGMDEYLRSFVPILQRAAENCRPELIIISCGFDAHRGDPIGNMNLDEQSFQEFTKVILEIANKYCEGRVVSILEGGYNPKVIERCVRSHLEILMDD